MDLTRSALMEGLAFLSLSFITTVFGNAMQPISLLAWLQPSFYLRATYCLLTYRTSLLWQVASILLLICSQNIGVTIAYWSIFNLENQLQIPWDQPGLVFVLEFAATAAFTVLIYLPAAVLWAKYPRGPLQPFFFAASFTSVTFIINNYFAPSSNYADPAVATLDSASLANLLSLFGSHGINFLIGWSCALLARKYAGLGGLFARSTSSSSLPTFVSSHLSSLFILLLVSFSYGGGRFYSKTFFQRPLNATSTPVVSVSCITEELALGDNAEFVWDATKDRVLAEDEFVLWSESAVQIKESEEQTFIKRAQKLARLGNHSYIGLAYFCEHDNATDSGRNMFVLITPDGEVAWEYAKAFPVPLIEIGTQPGNRKIAIHDSPYGRLGGMICFDGHHSGYVRQAGQQSVDLMLWPAWTWAAVGVRHFRIGAMRAVENGMSIAACCSYGVSGVATPTFDVPYRINTLSHEVHTFKVPLERHMWTLYGHSWGWIFPWLLLILTLLAWPLVVLPCDLPGDFPSLAWLLDESHVPCGSDVEEPLVAPGVNGSTYIPT